MHVSDDDRTVIVIVLGPSAMLFVPSVNGISHLPLEMTVDEDVVNGANVLLGAVLRMDAAL